jgi:hypothetical protein
MIGSTGPILHPTGTVTNPTERIIGPTGAIGDPTGLIIHPTGVIIDPTGVMTNPTGAKILTPLTPALSPPPRKGEGEDIRRQPRDPLSVLLRAQVSAAMICSKVGCATI